VLFCLCRSCICAHRCLCATCSCKETSSAWPSWKCSQTKGCVFHKQHGLLLSIWKKRMCDRMFCTTASLCVPCRIVGVSDTLKLQCFSFNSNSERLLTSCMCPKQLSHKTWRPPSGPFPIGALSMLLRASVTCNQSSQVIIKLTLEQEKQPACSLIRQKQALKSDLSVGQGSSPAHFVSAA